LDDDEERPDLEEEPSGMEDEDEDPQEDPFPEDEHTWADSLDGQEEGDTTGMKLFKVLIPFAIPAVIFAILFLFMDYGRFLQLGGLALGYLFPPFGKESIIPIGIGAGFTKWQMTGLIFMVDVVCAMFISWNLPLAKKIPLIGRLLTWLERKGSEILADNPALMTGAWFALVLFVMVPFQGSGGITASIVGRAIGMRASYVISAVALGALISGFLIGTAAEIGWEAIRSDLVNGMIMVLMGVLAALVALLFFRLHKIRVWEAELQE
jgi:hypothetical protein